VLAVFGDVQPELFSPAKSFSRRIRLTDPGAWGKVLVIPEVKSSEAAPPSDFAPNGDEGQKSFSLPKIFSYEPF